MLQKYWNGPYARLIASGDAEALELFERNFDSLNATAKIEYVRECTRNSHPISEKVISALVNIANPNWYPERLQPTVAAGQELLRIGDSRALDALIARLQNGTTPKLRWQAARILGELADPRAIEPLIRALVDETLVRTEAAVALKKLGQPNWEQWIKGHSKYDFLELAKSNAPQKIELLISALENKNSSSLEASQLFDMVGASFGLATIGDPRAVKWLLKIVREVKLEAATAVKYLEKSLKMFSHLVPLEELTEIASLGNILHTTPGIADGPEPMTSEVDCTGVRQLAELELRRRGP